MSSIERVQEALRALGLGHQVVDLGLSARTAADAAKAVGCQVDQIAKSLVFRLRESGRPLLVVTSGAHRVDETKVATLVGESLVRAETGFAIGGVAPIGLARPVLTLIDEHLMAFEAIWAAAGHPNSVFRLTPAELVTMTGGRVVTVS
jgi:prolyl-tRNA editing enzyme YbaK/EbsC (Cys-tRNA(Pro) deacylase)